MMLIINRYLHRFFVGLDEAVGGVLVVVVCGVVSMAGCSDSGSFRGEVQLARVGDRVLTVSGFESALDVALAAYPPESAGTPAVLADLRRQLLTQLIEEMVLESKAASIGVTVTDQEVDRAVADIKKDYPDDTFKEMLLENAVPLNAWQDRLRMRLLMEKVITTQLADTVQVTPEDIAGYYKAHGEPEGAADGSKASDSEADVVKQIRQQKLEAAYSRWMKEAKRRFPVEINDAAWKETNNRL